MVARIGKYDLGSVGCGYRATFRKSWLGKIAPDRGAVRQGCPIGIVLHRRHGVGSRLAKPHRFELHLRELDPSPSVDYEVVERKSSIIFRRVFSGWRQKAYSLDERMLSERSDTSKDS